MVTFCSTKDEQVCNTMANLQFWWGGGISRVRDYKTFSMLNSAELEILPAYKQQITDEYCCFLAQFSRM